MSDYVTFDIQTEILKRLPVISLIRFRSVSKQWKSLIESYEFIIDHTRINSINRRCHLLVRHMSDGKPQYTSIIDDHTFPNKKSSLTLPPILSSLYDCSKILSSVNGLSCFYGYNYFTTESPLYPEKRRKSFYGYHSEFKKSMVVHSEIKKSMVVLWNDPIIRKSVGIVIPAGSKNRYFVIGFGFCSDTSDPKLVRINRVYQEREVMVFTLSSRVWKTVSNVLPALGSCRLTWNQVCNKGCIYWCAKDGTSGEDGETNVIVSFDLESEKFGQVRLPESLLQTDYWELAEVNESLGVLADDYSDHGYYVRVCGVWMMDFVTKSFTKMFTIQQPRCRWPFRGLFGVLGFRKNGEVIIEAQEDGLDKSRLEVYEPSSGRTNDIGINGQSSTQSVSLYQETLLLLDETSSIIDETSSIIPTFPQKEKKTSSIIRTFPKRKRRRAPSFLNDDVGRYNYQSHLD